MSERTREDLIDFWSTLPYHFVAIGVPVAVVIGAIGAFGAFVDYIIPEAPPPLCFDVVRTVELFNACPDSTHNASVQGAYVVCSCPR